MSEEILDTNAIKKKLIDMKHHLKNSLKSVSDDVRVKDDTKGHSQHQADQGTDGFGQTISIEVSSAEQEIIRQIDRAIEKIDEGTYGLCDASGEKIPRKRLEAIPYATLSIEAQEKMENKDNGASRN